MTLYMYMYMYLVFKHFSSVHCMSTSTTFHLSQNRSFSLLYSGRSLDIVCKDKREYEAWTRGLQVSNGPPSSYSTLVLTMRLGLP